MIKAIIFSKNRPMQLHLLLESLQRYCKDYFNISVLYAADENYRSGYSLVAKRFPEANFILESNFRNDLLKLESLYKHTTFFTDDDIIYRPFDLNAVTNAIKDDTATFSLRLGLNTTFSYPMHRDNKKVNVERTEGNIIYWNWRYNDLDYNYPIACDGHVILTDRLFGTLKKIRFSNPNTMESEIQRHKIHLPRYMAAFDHSVLVNSPSNVVQKTFFAANGIKFPFSVDELSKKYLSGEIIDFEQLDFSNIIGGHQELNFNFKLYGNT